MFLVYPILELRTLTAAVDQRRKCEMNFLRKRYKTMTKLCQGHIDCMQRYIFAIIIKQSNGLQIN